MKGKMTHEVAFRIEMNIYPEIQNDIIIEFNVLFWEIDREDRSSLKTDYQNKQKGLNLKCGRLDGFCVNMFVISPNLADVSWNR